MRKPLLVSPLCVVFVTALAVSLPSAEARQTAPAVSPAKSPADQRIEVTGISLEGVKAVPQSSIKRVMLTRKSDWLPWGDDRYLDRERLQADLARIEAFYRARGFPQARIASLDLQFNDDQTNVTIRIVIDEGEAVLVEAIDYEGFDVIPAEHLAEVRKQALIQPGEPRDIAEIQASRDTAAAELRDHGFPYASVVVSESDGSSERQVKLTYAARPGTKALFGPIEIVGNSTVGDGVIRRQLTYRPGDLFRESQMLTSQRKLYSIELFQFGNIETVAPEEQPAEVPTRVTVAESKHQHVRFSLGYGTEEHARGEIEYRHVNFLGGGRIARVHGKYSSLEQGVRVDFTEPYFLRNNWSFGAFGQNWVTDEPMFDLQSIGGRATFSHRKLQRGRVATEQRSNTFSFSYINEYKDYTISPEALNDPTLRDDLIAMGLDPTTGRGVGTLSAVSFGLNRTTVDNVLDARVGYFASVQFEQAGRFLSGSFNYVELTTEGRYFLPIGGRAVLAQRVQFGSIDGSGGEGAVPFFKRYFLGGSSSLRGWGRFEVSPLSGDGLAIGGHTMIESATELRVPLWGRFSGVLFLDAGNVWPNAWDINLNDLRADIGPGLRVATPIGPIRLDVGWQLTKIEGLVINGAPEARHFRVHFSIGQAF